MNIDQLENLNSIRILLYEGPLNQDDLTVKIKVIWGRFSANVRSIDTWVHNFDSEKESVATLMSRVQSFRVFTVAASAFLFPPTSPIMVVVSVYALTQSIFRIASWANCELFKMQGFNQIFDPMRESTIGRIVSVATKTMNDIAFFAVVWGIAIELLIFFESHHLEVLETISVVGLVVFFVTYGIVYLGFLMISYGDHTPELLWEEYSLYVEELLKLQNKIESLFSEETWEEFEDQNPNLSRDLVSQETLLFPLEYCEKSEKHLISPISYLELKKQPKDQLKCMECRSELKENPLISLDALEENLKHVRVYLHEKLELESSQRKDSPVLDGW